MSVTETGGFSSLAICRRVRPPLQKAFSRRMVFPLGGLSRACTPGIWRCGRITAATASRAARLRARRALPWHAADFKMVRYVEDAISHRKKEDDKRMQLRLRARRRAQKTGQQGKAEFVKMMSIDQQDAK